MDYTFEKSKNEIENLHKAIAYLEQSYFCDWNDTVHESYRPYVNKCIRAVWGMEQAMEGLEKNCSRLYDIDSERLIHEAADVCEKIRAF